TVSERYAAEIQRPEFGEGLDEVLRANVHKLYGIVNGIDYEQFDPGRDPNIPHHYSATAPEAKALDRAELRTELGLERVDRPLCAIVSRVDDVKGLDQVEQAVPAVLGQRLQRGDQGTGDRRYAGLSPWGVAAGVRAWETYRHHSVWSWLVRRAMSEDVSWSRSAQKYLQLYRSAIANHRERRGIAALEG